jgi:peptidoglycan/xylan/chitin deacetylase (PgdA/CDA1 family)
MTVPVSRRAVIVAGAAAALSACGRSRQGAPPAAPTTPEAVGSAPASTAPSSTGTVPPVGPARYVDHGRRDTPTVALTFHASGDVTLAHRLLDLLAARAVAVTVFAVGNWLAAHPDLGTRILHDGHELANHTYSHQPMGQLSPDAIRDEITRCATVLTRVSGSVTSWFRPSGIDVPTDTILAMAGVSGYPVSVGYDVDSLDYQDPGPTTVAANVKRSVQPGSIVSLHFGHAGTIAAMPSLLDHLAGAGLQPVTVTRVLA